MPKDIRNVYGEYDPPLPEINMNSTAEDKEKLARLEEKYKKLAEERKKNIKQ